MPTLIIKNIEYSEDPRIAELNWKDLEPNLVPTPKKLQFDEQFIILTEQSELSWFGSELIPQFVNELKDEFISRNILVPNVEQLEQDFTLGEEIEQNASDEIYSLKISGDSVEILAQTDKGIYYGIQTLYQLITTIEDLTVLPCIEIVDFPDMAVRGLSDDMSRGCVGSVENVKRYIQFLSRFKLNNYMFYWEDILCNSEYPDIGRNRGGWTKEEVLEVQRYAQAHCVELVMIQNTLGHMETYFWNPKFIPYAEFPGSSCLNVAHPDAYTFLESILKEECETFESTSFHMACDESYDVGMKGAKELLEQMGSGSLYLRHYTNVMDILRKYGKKRVYLYHDISSKYEEVLEGLPKDLAVFVYWEYGVKKVYPNLDKVAACGVPFVVSSSTLDWGKIFPNVDESIQANYRLIEDGLKYGAIGEICSSWGDNGNENLREHRLFAWAAASVMGWNFAKFDQQTFTRAYFRELFGMCNSDVEQLWANLCSLPKEMNSEPFKNYYPHFWRHPFAVPVQGGEIDLAGQDYSVDFKADKIPFLESSLVLIQQIRPLIKKNNYSLDCLEYCLLSVKLLVEKIQMIKKCELLDQQSSIDLSAYEALILPIIETFMVLREKFEYLWSNSSKRPRLDEFLRYFDWMIFWLEQRLALLRDGIVYKSPMLLGDWISDPEQSEKITESCFFRKVFMLNEEDYAKIQRVHVQMIPCTYGTVWINDQLIGSAPVFEDSTYLLMDHRELFCDLSPELLHIGENVLEIEANMQPSGFPTIHFLMQWDILNEPPRILVSDLTWKVSNSHEGPWKRVISRGHVPAFFGETFMPNFKLGWHSFYTLHHFGAIVRELNRQPPNMSPLFYRFWAGTRPFI